MEASTRERMISSATILLASGGYQATSFGAVLEHAKAPRGSIYHHFPDGKDQLIAAAIASSGERAIALLDSLRGRPAPEVVDGFMHMWRAVLGYSDFGAGCSVLAVTVSADNDDLLLRARSIFRAWGQALAELLRASGVADADDAAVTLIAASEGAVVLARADRSFEPFDRVHAQLRRMVG